MAYDLEEQETLDAVRAWWDRYGTLCVVLVVAVVVAAAGWRGWQWYDSHKAAQAMGYFEALESAARHDGEESTARVKAASATLRSDFPRSGYTSRGLLIAADVLNRRGDADGAQEQLSWLIANGNEPALASLARLRLAGILFEQKNYAEALAQLDNAPPAFAGLYADRRGDIFAAQGDVAQARSAWTSALEQLGNSPVAQIVQLKLDALGGV